MGEPSLIYVSARTLALLASQQGTLAGTESTEPQTRAEREAAEDAAEQAEDSQRRRLAEMRRRLWSVMHKLPPDEAAIIQGISAGQTHQVVAARLGCCRSTISARLPTIVNRIRHLLALPELPDTAELRAHLAECAALAKEGGSGPKARRRVVAFLDGASLRAIGADEECDHKVIHRSVKRAMRKVCRAGATCDICHKVAKTYALRRKVRPPTATPRLVEFDG